MRQFSDLECDQARHRLTVQVLGARTLAEIYTATQALSDWIADHPEDEGMSDAFEQLSLMQDIAAERVAQQSVATTNQHQEKVA